MAKQAQSKENVLAEAAGNTAPKNTGKVILIRRPPDEKNVKAKIVGINGVMYSVPYDTEVEVPPEVYEVLKRSEAALREADRLEDELSGETAKL